ncbi:uncharacterized protein PV09_02483 [Verruconis gallopava]|uniref:ERCC1-like central domain-containing protein n=1 Tax=Verruconis gallopava TaxID=253628 RepID=A0A0D2AIS3_9PEZI|nr:uncharacterized protein PV09_02483 [Verruconis gallopava]KIW06803.1 hypothetical protein PV09_02483 [Verruconis gallopava]
MTPVEDNPPPRSTTPITSNRRVFQPAARPAQDSISGVTGRGVQQLKPNALPARHSASNILVSNRQHGNPVLKEIKSQAWEFADIPADYVLGATTCALYLSLKYHRLHPHYIYNRIRDLAGKYNLRILLVMVDVTNHEEHLKELSKTSLVNNITLILCWSAAEAGRYLELYKTYEHAPATMIKAPVSTSHGDRVVDFITTPRSINKTDAMSLVGNFGSIRTAVNARPEELSMIGGWGPTKVKQWHAAVTEPFRNRKAAKRGPEPSSSRAISSNTSPAEGDVTSSASSARPRSPAGAEPPYMDRRPPKRPAEGDEGIDSDEEDVMREMIDQGLSKQSVSVNAPPGTRIAKPAPSKKPEEPGVDDGVMAALARLREAGGR